MSGKVRAGHAGPPMTRTTPNTAFDVIIYQVLEKYNTLRSVQLASWEGLGTVQGRPQQATEPFFLSPHVCESMALTEMNWPGGGVDWL